MLRITDITRLLKRGAGREVITFGIAGSGAATAANYTIPLTPRAGVITQPARILGVSVRYVAASTSGTLQVRRCGPTVAVAAGDNVLASTIDLSQTAETSYAGTLSTTEANLIVRPGDCLYLVAAGTLTNLSGIGVQIVLQRLMFSDLREQ